MMKALKLILLTALALLAAASLVTAQHMHGHDPSEDLGRVNFRISCSPAAQEQFNRAVAWLHSFEYEEAEKAFGAVTVTDPSCAMGYWGIAMSQYHPLWVPPTPAQLQKGTSALSTSATVDTRTQRE